MDKIVERAFWVGVALTAVGIFFTMSFLELMQEHSRLQTAVTAFLILGLVLMLVGHVVAPILVGKRGT